MNEEAQKLLKGLLDKIPGCIKPGCLACKHDEEQVRRLAELLGVDPASIMPWHLTEEARKQYRGLN